MIFTFAPLGNVAFSAICRVTHLHFCYAFVTLFLRLKSLKTNESYTVTLFLAHAHMCACTYARAHARKNGIYYSIFSCKSVTV